ncbi:aromatic amino acid transaminase [Sphingosinicella rhizophila]|uniref:Aromatic amino acid transaminase n=1 Tax=Sphingosinicella rhizophila TaxID=3050082 RepID=A0ABU3Q6F9_9SPHN|nr:aromatic amino acid transaminase [Sphingosinicella sp. GR2756]MDT9598669.1 aromatic amino acid transaminase [Sphingosinicella sp. GR2756]
MFENLAAPAPDALHAVMDRYRADTRPHKIDLGVGVFRDENGTSPIMKAVREAELALAQEKGGTKAYLPLAGDPLFRDCMRKLIWNDADHGRIAAVQGTGGTGALRLAVDLVKFSAPLARVHLGLPSWPSHEGLAKIAGLELVTHQYFDRETASLDWPSIEVAANRARKNDLFILHGPCHNPTGEDLSPEQREALLAILRERGAVPLIDAAYCGLGDGLDRDLEAIRRDVDGFDRAFIAFSCSKSFGLYRERTGILFAITQDAAEADIVQRQLERISRTLVSMPPSHGAAIVAHILQDEALTQSWRVELDRMKSRIDTVRLALGRLASDAPALAKAAQGRGIFTLLPLSPDQVDRLASDSAIHMPGSGRINITGLKEGDAARLATALQRI